MNGNESNLIGQMNLMNDDLNMPTLMSKSPPSTPTENEISANDFDFNNQMNNLSLAENSLNESQANSDRAELNQIVNLTESEKPVPSNELQTTHTEFTWNPFETANENF